MKHFHDVLRGTRFALVRATKARHIVYIETTAMQDKKSTWELFKSSVAQWLEDQPFQMASSLAYYTIFSLAPLLIIVIAIAGFGFGSRQQSSRLWERYRGQSGSRVEKRFRG